MKNQSSYAKQQSRINGILHCIQNHGQIHKFELMEEMRITIAEYNQLKPLLEFFGEREKIHFTGIFWTSEKEPGEIKKENNDQALKEANDVLKQYREEEIESQ